MRQIEINPKQAFAELQALQQRERKRLIDSATAGQTLTAVQRRQLEIELENSTRFVSGELIAVDSDGNPLNDPHGWPLPVQDYIRETALSLFASTPEAQQVKAPVNRDELFNRMKAAKSDKERQQIYQAYKNS